MSVYAIATVMMTTIANGSMTAVLGILELRYEVMGYLAGWEISALIAATRIGWTDVARGMSRNVMRNMFENAIPIVSKIGTDNTIVIVGPVPKMMMEMIKNPFVIVTGLELMKTMTIGITIVNVRKHVATINHRGATAYEFTEGYRCMDAYSNTSWSSHLRTTVNVLKVAHVLLTPTMGGNDIMRIVATKGSLVYESVDNVTYLDCTTVRKSYATTRTIECTSPFKSVNMYETRSAVLLPIMCYDDSVNSTKCSIALLHLHP